MGLSHASTGAGVLEKELRINRITPNDKIIALGGNPNVGKSTVFNNLTGFGIEIYSLIKIANQLSCKLIYNPTGTLLE